MSTSTITQTPSKTRTLVDMNWDPITRIVGSLGIYTKIDFNNREVAECYSTSSIFRGYSIFMKGKDPRDAHFITSRICGICGDNHATCATYAQNMAFGVRPPEMAEWIVNLGEAAEYMFDHNIFQDNLVGVDFCEQMVRETNPGVWEKAKTTEAPHAADHGYKTIAEIMTALNPFTGEFYRETLHVSRYTREMFCLMEGRHVHPSTLYPGGVGTVPTIQLFTDYIVRLMRYCEFMKKVVPLHDDLFDFFYEALPGYEKVGQRRILLGCWGSFQDPKVCDYTYKNMNEWGNAMYVTPGVVVDGKLVTTDLVDINLGIRILLGSSYYDDWDNSEMFVKTIRSAIRLIGNIRGIRRRCHGRKSATSTDKYTWVMSPRWYHNGPGDISRARYRRRSNRALLGNSAGRQGGHRLRQGNRPQREDLFAEDGDEARSRVRVEDSQVEQRHRTRSRPHLLPGVCGSGRTLLCRTGVGRTPCGPDQDVDASSRCRMRPSAAASTKRCAACCRITW